MVFWIVYVPNWPVRSEQNALDIKKSIIFFVYRIKLMF